MPTRFLSPWTSPLTFCANPISSRPAFVESSRVPNLVTLASANYGAEKHTYIHTYRRADIQTARIVFCVFFTICCLWRNKTRSSADADNRLDAFSGQSRSTNMVPTTIPHVTYSFLLCNSNFVFKTCRFYDIRLPKISWPWNGGQRSLKVIESGIIR